MKLCFTLSAFIFIVNNVIQTISSQEYDLESSISNLYYNNKIFIASDFQTDATSAEFICSSSGGTLINDWTPALKQKLINILVENLVSEDFFSIYIYKHQRSPNFLKFRLNSSDHHDDQNADNWIKPSEGMLRTLRFHKKPVPGFDRKIYFCCSQGRDLISSVSCRNGWRSNFVAYSGYESTPNDTTEISVFSSNVPRLHSMVVLGHGCTPRSYKRHSSRYLLDISVFIGARSDVNQTNWCWNNGTMVNNPMFPTSNKSVCQQMTWPLTYDDGMNLHARNCKEDGYFLCQFELNFQVRGISTCNGSSIHLSWTPIKLRHITKQSLNYYLEVQLDSYYPAIEIVGYDIFRNASLNESKVCIDALKPQTSYVLQIKLKNKFSSVMRVVSTKTVYTGVEKSDHTTKARIINSNHSKECLIEWEHDLSNNCSSFYQIFISSKEKLLFLEVNIKKLYTAKKYLERNKKIILKNINLREFPKNSKVCLKLQTTCNGKKQEINVKGSCLAIYDCPEFVVKKYISQQNPTTVGIVLGIVTIILFVSFVRLKKSRTKSLPGLKSTRRRY